MTEATNNPTSNGWIDYIAYIVAETHSRLRENPKLPPIIAARLLVEVNTMASELHGLSLEVGDARASARAISSATATSRRCANSTQAHCSRGSAWPPKAWAYGPMNKRRRVSKRSSTPSCRASVGSRRNWRASVTTPRKPANWTSQPATYWRPSRCTSALRASTARRMRKQRRCCWYSTRQNNDARPTVRAKSQSAAITHW